MLEIGKDRVVFEGKYLRVVEREFHNTETGYRGVWQVVERPSKRPIAVIVPMTPQREVVLTKTFRVPLKAWMIEMCAGMVDASDINEEAAARREALEEMGYKVGKVKELFRGPHNAGMQADELVVFLGLDAKKVQEPHLEDGECLEAIKVPIDKLMEFLRSQPPEIRIDVKLWGLIALLENEGRETKPANSYTRRILWRSDTEEEVRTIWPPGAKSVAHDHGDSHGWTMVTSGTLHVKTFDKATLVVINECDYKPGEVFEEISDEIHLVSNLGSEEATAFHRYSPPLKMKAYPNLA